MCVCGHSNDANLYGGSGGGLLDNDNYLLYFHNTMSDIPYSGLIIFGIICGHSNEANFHGGSGGGEIAR